jgi:hypothetical protein
MMNADAPLQSCLDPWTSPKPCVITLAKLLPGDMLLHRGSNKPARAAIKVATKSPNTHASMYFGLCALVCTICGSRVRWRLCPT